MTMLCREATPGNPWASVLQIPRRFFLRINRALLGGGLPGGGCRPPVPRVVPTVTCLLIGLAAATGCAGSGSDGSRQTAPDQSGSPTAAASNPSDLPPDEPVVFRLLACGEVTYEDDLVLCWRDADVATFVRHDFGVAPPTDEYDSFVAGVVSTYAGPDFDPDEGDSFFATPDGVLYLPRTFLNESMVLTLPGTGYEAQIVDTTLYL